MAIVATPVNMTELQFWKDWVSKSLWAPCNRMVDLPFRQESDPRG